MKYIFLNHCKFLNTSRLDTFITKQHFYLIFCYIFWTIFPRNKFQEVTKIYTILPLMILIFPWIVYVVYFRSREDKRMWFVLVWKNFWHRKKEKKVWNLKSQDCLVLWRQIFQICRDSYLNYAFFYRKSSAPLKFTGDIRQISSKKCHHSGRLKVIRTHFRSLLF